MSFELKALKDICTIQIGKTPSRHENDYWRDGTHAWLSIADMNQGRYLTKTKECITDLGVNASNIKLIPKNTLVLSYKLSIGKVGITQKPMYTNEAIASLTELDSQVDINYLYWALQHIDLLENADRAAMGKTLNKAKLSEVKIPLPPLVEQRRIVSILDQADELRQKRQQAIEKLDQLLQATFIDMFGDPVSNPKGFKVAKLAEQVDLIQIGPFGTQLHQEDYIENGIPLINPSHIKNGKIIPNDKLTVSKSKHEELTQYHLRLNDVLLGRRGEMGRCAVVTEKEVGWLCGTGSLFIRPNREKINPFFLELLLSSDSIKKYLENVSQGQTMANLNKSIVGAIPLILPSIEIQNKFFIISEKIDKMKSEFKNAKNRANNLFESLQNQAFSGNL